jgi:hypothetical protein
VALDNWLLLASALLALALVLAVLLLARRGRSLRARLVVVFVTLALAPSSLTLVFLWRELAPRSRLSVAQGVERSLDDAVSLARREVATRHGEALAMAQHAAQRVAAGAAPESALDSLAATPYVALLAEPGARRVLAGHGTWTHSQARAFLDLPAVGWPASRLPVQLLTAPDSTAVVVGVARVANSKPATVTVVALSLPSAQAAAIRNLVAGVQHAHRLGF